MKVDQFSVTGSSFAGTSDLCRVILFRKSFAGENAFTLGKDCCVYPACDIRKKFYSLWLYTLVRQECFSFFLFLIERTLFCEFVYILFRYIILIIN